MHFSEKLSQFEPASHIHSNLFIYLYPFLFIFQIYKMTILEILTPYVPELIGVFCFVIGFIFLNTFKTADDEQDSNESLIQKSNQFEPIEKTNESFSQFCTNPEGKTIKSLNSLLKTCKSNKNLDKLLEIFNYSLSPESDLKPDLETYEIVSLALFEFKKFSEAVNLLSPAFPGFASNEAIQTVLIESFSRLFQIEKAVELFEQSQIKDKLFPKLMTCLIKTNNQERISWLYSTYRPASTDTIEVVLETACRFDCVCLVSRIITEKLSLSKVTFTSSVKCLVKNSFLDAALGLISSSPELRDDSILCYFIDNCAKQGRAELVATIIQDFVLGRIELSLYTINSLLDLCVKHQRQPELWEVVIRMVKIDVLPDPFSYSCIVKSIKQEGEMTDIDKAFELLACLDEKKVVQTDEILYNCLLDACVSNRKVDKALRLFEEMPKLDEISYNTIIKGFSMTRQVDKAIEILTRMKANGVSPTAVTYNSIIDTCVRCSKVALAWEYLEEMQQRGLNPDNFTYSTLVKGIKGENSSYELSRVLSIIEKGKATPDEVLFNCLIDACSRSGDTSRCVNLFRQMQSSKIEASSVTYGIMIKAYGQANMLSKAIDVFNEMSQKGLKANDVTYGCLLDACVKSGEIEMAQKLFVSMQQEGVVLNTILYTTMIKGFSKTQNLAKALEIFGEMKKSVQPNNVTYNSLIDCAVRCEDLKTANKLFAEMRGLMQPDLISYSTMIKGLCRAGEVQAALGILINMRQSNIQPDEVLFNSLLDGCAKLGNLDVAETVYTDMKGLGIKPSNVTYSILIKLYGKSKQINRALEVLDDMKVHKVQPGLIVYTCLLQACIRCKQIHKAIQLYHDMIKSNVKGDRVTFNTLVNGCVYAKQLDSAVQIANDSFLLGIQLADDVYSNLIKNLVASKISNKASMALDVYESMKKVGAQLDPALISLVVPSKINSENSFSYGAKKTYNKKVAMGERSFNIH